MAEPLKVEFEDTGAYFGLVFVTVAGKTHVIGPPELKTEYTLDFDWFADVEQTDDGFVVHRAGPSASGMQNPVPCWSKKRVHALVRKLFEE